MGRNIQFISHTYDISFNSNLCDWSELIKSHWGLTYNQEDVRVGNMIIELAHKRDTGDPWLLEGSECQDIINDLCTS